MFSTKKSILKLTSRLLVLVFATQTAFAYKPEDNIWKERQNEVKRLQSEKQNQPIQMAGLSPSDSSILTTLPSAIKELPSSLKNGITHSSMNVESQKEISSLLENLSNSYGTVRDISLPKNKTPRAVVVHIHDVHMNAEAQSNIQKTIRSLVDNDKAQLLALEGKSDAIDFTSIKQVVHPDTLQKVADFFVRTNQMSGPAQAAFTSPKTNFNVLGIDDQNLYEQNIQAYKNTISLYGDYKKSVERSAQGLNVEKKNNLNTSLFAFDSLVDQYRRETIDLSSFIERLTKSSDVLSPQLQTFLEASHLEKSLDFARVEKERTALLEVLVHKLSEKNMSDLMKMSVAFRTGALHQSDFYSYLMSLCHKGNVSLASYPAMHDYIHYVLLSDGINTEKLMAEIKSAEINIYQSLVVSASEKNLIDQSSYLSLTAKLLDFSLSSEEWNEYKSLKESFQSNQPKFFAKLNQLSSFEQFYDLAEARDQRMASNLLAALSDKKNKTIILVTGGFHSRGITNALKKANVATMAFVPRLTKIDAENSNYLSIFAQEKAPLNTLFDKEKLFLIPFVTPGAHTTNAAAALTEESAHPGSLARVMDKLFPGVPYKTSKIVNGLRALIGNFVVSVTIQKEDIENFSVQENPNGKSVSGSSHGRLFIDPIFEAFNFLLPQIGGAVLVGLSLILGMSGPVLLLVYFSGAILTHIISADAIRSHFVSIHGLQAYASAKRWNPSLTPATYKAGVSNFFNQTYVSTQVSSWMLISSLYVGNLMGLDAQSIIALALIGTLIINIVIHEFNNLMFALAHFEFKNFSFSDFFASFASPVPGAASWKGEIPQETEAEKKMSDIDAVSHYRDLLSIHSDKKDFYEERIKFRTSRLRDALRNAVTPLLAKTTDRMEKDLKNQLRDKSNKEMLRYPDFFMHVTKLLHEKAVDPRWIIGVTGTTAGGKSTYAERIASDLADQYPDRTVRVIDLHRFQYPGSDAANPFDRYDMSEVTAFIQDLKAGSSTQIPAVSKGQSGYETVGSPQASKKEIFVLVGNPILKSNQLDLTVNVNAGFIFRRRRSTKQILSDKKKSQADVESEIEKRNMAQMNEDTIVDQANQEATEKFGRFRKDPKTSWTHFQLNGLTLAEQIFRAYSYGYLTDPDVADYFQHEFGINVLDLAKDIDAIGDEVLIDWVEQMRAQHQESGREFRHPAPLPGEKELSQEGYFERYWGGGKPNSFVTLSLGQQLLIKAKILGDDKNPILGLADAEKTNLQNILNRVGGLFAGAEIISLGGRVGVTPGKWAGRIKYIALKSMKREDSVVQSPREAKVGDVMMMNQLPYVESRLRALAGQVQQGNSNEKVYQSGLQLLQSFFDVQRKMWARGIVDRAPGLAFRYGVDVRHGREEVVGMGPGSYVLDKEALTVFQKIAAQHEASPENRDESVADVAKNPTSWNTLIGKYNGIANFNMLSGFQLQFIVNINTGEDFLASIPAEFQTAYVELVRRNVPKSAQELQRMQFGEEWQNAVTKGREAEFRNTGVSSAVMEDLQISKIEQSMADHSLDLLAKDFSGYFANEHDRPGTPQLAWVSMFASSQPQDLNNGLFSLANSLLNLLLINPNLINEIKQKETSVEGQIEQLSKLVRADEEASQNKPIRKPWENMVFRNFLIGLLDTPSTWTKFDEKNKTNQSLVHRIISVIAPKFDSDYHENLFARMMKGDLTVPVVKNFKRKMKIEEAHLNLDRHSEHATSSAQRRAFIEVAWNKFKTEKMKDDKVPGSGEKILNIKMWAGESSRMGKGEIAELLLDALGDNAAKFIDPDLINKKLFPDEIADISHRGLQAVISEMVAKARRKEVDKRGDKEIPYTDKLKDLLYQAKALAPVSKVGDTWYNFIDLHLLNMRKANDELEAKGVGRRFIAGAFMNEKYNKSIHAYLKSVNYYGFTEGKDLVFFTQPMGYAVGLSENDVAQMIREEEIKLQQGKIDAKEAEFKNSRMKRQAREYARANEGRVLAELGKKAEGHGWIFTAMLLKEGGIAEPPVVTFKKLGIREVIISNVDNMFTIDDNYLAGYGMKIANKMLTTLQFSYPTPNEKGKGGGVVMVDHEGKLVPVQAEWDIIEATAKKMGKSPDEFIKEVPFSPFNNATIQTDVMESFDLYFGDKFQQAFAKNPQERDAELAAMVPELASKMEQVPLKRFEAISDPADTNPDVSKRAKILIGRVIYESRAWTFQNADLSRVGAIYTASADSFENTELTPDEIDAKFNAAKDDKQGQQKITDARNRYVTKVEKMEFIQQIEFFRDGEFGGLKKMEDYSNVPLQLHRRAKLGLVVSDSKQHQLFRDEELPAVVAVAASSTANPKWDAFHEQRFFLMAPLAAILMGVVSNVLLHQMGINFSLMQQYMMYLTSMLAGLAAFVWAGPLLQNAFVAAHGEKAFNAVNARLAELQQTALTRSQYDQELVNAFHQYSKITFLSFGGILFGFFLLNAFSSFVMSSFVAAGIASVIAVVHHAIRNTQFFGASKKAANADVKWVGDSLIAVALKLAQGRRGASFVTSITGAAKSREIDTLLGRTSTVAPSQQPVNQQALLAYVQDQMAAHLNEGRIDPASAEKTVELLGHWLGTTIDLTKQAGSKDWKPVIVTAEQAHKLLDVLARNPQMKVDVLANDEAGAVLQAASASVKGRLTTTVNNDVVDADKTSLNRVVVEGFLQGRFTKAQLQNSVLILPNGMTYTSGDNPLSANSPLMLMGIARLEDLLSGSSVTIIPMETAIAVVARLMIQA